MYQFAGVRTVRRGELPPGRAGTIRTLEMMRDLARQGGADMAVRQQAHRIIRNAGVRGHDFMGEARALFQWVRDRVRYVKDPFQVETLQSPRVTLQDRMGDCDDKATLLAGLLLSVGHPARIAFRAIGTNPFGNSFSHVYVAANIDGRQIAMDPTRERTPFGWEFRRPALRGDFPV